MDTWDPVNSPGTFPHVGITLKDFVQILGLLQVWEWRLRFSVPVAEAADPRNTSLSDSVLYYPPSD